MADPIRILHVEDAPEFASLTADVLEEDGRFAVLTEHDPREAVDRLAAERQGIDCVVSDYEMPHMTGLELLREIDAQFPNSLCPFVLFTGKGSEEVAAEALNAGATSYVQKGGTDTFEYLRSRIVHDVEASAARRDSLRFGALVQSLGDPVYVVDERGEFAYVNEALAEAEIVHVTVEDSLTEELVAGLSSAIDRSVSVRLGGLPPGVEQLARTELPGATTFEPRGPWSEALTGRLAVVDERSALVSARASDGETDRSDRQNETAICGAGGANALVVLLSAISAWQSASDGA